jgi:hypothetical protein
VSGDEVFQFRVAPSRGASCTQGAWTDVTSGDGSFSFEPIPFEALRSEHVHVQVRVKPAFVPGYYRNVSGRTSGLHVGVSWWDRAPTDPSKWERVEVTPVVD